jgi:CHASE1-domain containing sensor protein
MQTAIAKVMYAYALIARLTPDQVKATRDRLAAHLAGMDADENFLAVEGMRYLRRADRAAKRRTVRKSL